MRIVIIYICKQIATFQKLFVHFSTFMSNKNENKALKIQMIELVYIGRFRFNSMNISLGCSDAL